MKAIYVFELSISFKRAVLYINRMSDIRQEMHVHLFNLIKLT
jgi:hypothetical protein